MPELGVSACPQGLFFCRLCLRSGMGPHSVPQPSPGLRVGKITPTHTRALPSLTYL